MIDCLIDGGRPRLMRFRTKLLCNNGCLDECVVGERVAGIKIGMIRCMIDAKSGDKCKDVQDCKERQRECGRGRRDGRRQKSAV